MEKHFKIGQLLALVALVFQSLTANAQTPDADTLKVAALMTDTIEAPALTQADSALIVSAQADTLAPAKAKRDWAHWQPNAKTATWLAIFLPGAGQIYNRKFWKLPIVYGGFVGCLYAYRFNNMMYKDYKLAYHDIMDDDPETTSYNNLMHLGVEVTDANLTHYQNVFKQRRDRYRRWRDLSIFATVGVYLLQVIDAYVDASLSEFDISDDLSLRVEPTIMSNPNEQHTNLRRQAIGVQCALNF